MQSKLVKNFKNFIFREELFSGGEKLVVGISGGADSVCLVKLLLEIKEKFDLELQLVHINYGLRGEDSEMDEKFVRELAEKNNLKLEVVRHVESRKSKVESCHSAGDSLEGEKPNVKCQTLNRVDNKNNVQYTDISISTNLEERLRDFRYGVFEKIRIEKNFDWIVVAHHRDDQVETFLTNLFRGAGVEGLKGMKIQDEQRKILRPLLNFNRKEIVNFLKESEQEWREDKSNQDNTFLRNRIRNELIPEVEKKYSVKFKERVGSITKQLQQHLKIIDKEVYKSVGLVIKRIDSGIEIDVARYGELVEEIKPLVFRNIIRELKGDLKNISESNYLEFKKIIRSKKGKVQKMQIGNLKFEKVSKKLVILDVT